MTEQVSCRNQLIQGDAFSILSGFPDETFDLGITSPPYNKQEKNNGRLVSKVIYADFKDKLPEEDYQSKQVEVLDEIYRVTKDGGSPHPAPFPIWLPARIILSLLPQRTEALVLDPYVGSGTTAVATKLLGFDYVGIDISQEYLDYAENRLVNCEDDREKMEKECRLHVVKKTSSQRKSERIYTPKASKTAASLF